MDRFFRRLDRLIIFFVIYTIVYLVFFNTLTYTLPFVLAFIFAFILQRPTRYLVEKLKFKNGLASIITTLLFFSIIATMLSLTITSLINELYQLGKNTQQYFMDTSIISHLLNNIKDYYNNLDPSVLSTIQNNLSSSINKLSGFITNLVSGTISSLVNFLASIPYILMVILFTFLATYFFTKEMSFAKSRVKNFIPSSNSDKIISITKEAKRMLGNYAFSYTLIISITFIETLIGFLVFKVKYALILSFICAIADILPVLGIGTIYIPVVIAYYLSKHYVTSIGILILYILVTVIRQIIEPKIVSSSLGIHPLPILAAIFIGLKANGLGGMFFCVFLVVFYTIFKKVDIL